MRRCSGCCAFCQTPCYRGEIRGEQEKISSNFSMTPEEEQGVSEAFDNPSTELAVVENVGTYEVTKNIFGKEKTRRVK